MADDPYASIAHDPYASIASGTTPAPASGGLDLGAIGKNIGGAVDAGARNFNAARTAAARDPVGALGNVFNAFPGAVTGGVMNPILQNTGNDIGQTLRSVGEGVLGGATNPSEADRYEKAFGDLQFHGMRPTGQDMLSRIGRGAQDFVAQTEIPGQGLPFKALAPLTKVAGKAIPAAANWVSDVAKDWTNPQVAAAARTLAKPVSKTLSGVRGVVNAGKDVLFLNPAVHGVGNLGMLNYLKNGVGTAAKGFKYGVTGTPQATRDELTRIGAEAFTPELMGKSSPWGPVGWAERLPGPTVAKAALGGAAGAGAGYGTDPSTDTAQQRLMRTVEGGLIGATVGGAPALRTGSNKLMTRLETGHRGAMLEDMPKPPGVTVPPPAAAAAAAPTKLKLKPSDFVVDSATGDIKLKPRVNPDNMRGKRQMDTPIQRQPAPRIKPSQPLGAELPPDPRAALINATFGGGKKSPGATLATAVGGPFAQWLTDIVPRNVGSAIVKHPERVAAATRVQNITNRDVLNDQPYKLQMGGPVGDMAEAMFNTPKYLSRIGGPLTQQDPNALTKPNTFSIGDALANAAYNATPGRSVIGPAFGDTMYPSRAPAAANAALGATLGWHFSNKTPATDAILRIMQSGPYTQQQAARIYERYKR